MLSQRKPGAQAMHCRGTATITADATARGSRTVLVPTPPTLSSCPAFRVSCRVPGVGPRITALPSRRLHDNEASTYCTVLSAPVINQQLRRCMTIFGLNMLVSNIGNHLLTSCRSIVRPPHTYIGRLPCSFSVPIRVNWGEKKKQAESSAYGTPPTPTGSSHGRL